MTDQELTDQELTDQELTERTNKNFNLQLTRAQKNFELLQELVSEDVVAVREGSVDRISQLHLSSSLAFSFIFSANRAYRILDKAGGSRIMMPRVHRKSFQKAIKPLVDSRDAAEHGFDYKPKEKSRLSGSEHESGAISVDQSSVIILGRDRILVGPHNLADLYVAVCKALVAHTWVPEEMSR